MKLTKWIPGNVKPVRVGVYQRKYGTDVVHYCLWNGNFWCSYGDTPKTAKFWKDTPSTGQTLPWRGLAEKPK